jgi:hypothetical protein
MIKERRRKINSIESLNLFTRNILKAYEMVGNYLIASLKRRRLKEDEEKKCEGAE